MTDTPPDTFDIAPVPPERWQSALELVLSQRVAAERTKLIWWLLQAPHRQRLDGLFEARVGGRMVGAGLALCMAGRTALVYQPRVSWGAPQAAANQLHEEMLQFLQQKGVLLAQEVLPIEAALDAAQARKNGFAIETTLLYYSREVGGFEREASDVLQLAICRETDRAVLERLIERTYVGTLDCPELNGVRPSFDVIQGYLEDRPWEEHIWRFLKVSDEIVGCFLVTPRPPNLCELVYLGLVPEYRGRGLGKLAAQHVIELAKQSGAGELTVAVDARNLPARKTYEGCGFVEFDRRRVMLCVLDH